MNFSKKIIIIGTILAIGLGILAGYLLFKSIKNTTSVINETKSTNSEAQLETLTRVEGVKPIIVHNANTPSVSEITQTPATHDLTRDGENYLQWNEEKQCYDESNFPIFHDVLRDESLGYDPNWLVGTEMPNGCIYYMHPNQGHDNNYENIERGQ